MSKLKAGDIVRSSGRFMYVGISREKYDSFQSIYTVKSTRNISGQPYIKLVEDSTSYDWAEEMFELVTSSNQIHITIKDTTTIAVLTDGKKEIRRAVAKCSPSDKFDFEVGAKLAFGRLMGEEVKKEESILLTSFDWESFKQGKIAVNCDTEEKASEFLKECDGQGIKWRSGDKPSSLTRYGAGYHTCDAGKNRLGYSKDEGINTRGIQIINYPFQPQYKEVKRVAQVGEWVKVVKNGLWKGNKYNVGEIHKVDFVNESCHFPYSFYRKENELYFADTEYVVLENYTPSIPTSSEPKPLDLSTLSDTELIAELQRRLEKRG